MAPGAMLSNFLFKLLTAQMPPLYITTLQTCQV